MSIWDDRILEFLREEGPASVGAISDNQYIRISNPSVSRRCAKLAEKGFLTPFGNGVYGITDRGEQYLDEELDADELASSETDDEGNAAI
jgi:Mn-dependent DtxR family transcriptional regulator